MSSSSTKDTPASSKELRAAQELFQKNIDHLSKQAKMIAILRDSQASEIARRRKEQAPEIARLRQEFLSQLETPSPTQPVAAQSTGDEGVAPDVKNFVLNALELLTLLQEKHTEVSDQVFMLQEEVLELRETLRIAQAERHDEQPRGQDVRLESTQDETLEGTQADKPTPSVPNHLEEDLVAFIQIEESYQLQDSVWDYSILIGLEEIGSLSSVLIATLVLINATLQLGLAFIINDLFTGKNLSDDDIGDMRDWRLHHAHSTRLMDSFTYEPFVKGVCAMSSQVYMSNPGGAFLAAIEGYLPRGELQEDPVIGPIMPYILPDIRVIGMLLSSIAVFIWGMTVARAADQLTKNWVAFHCIPLGEKTLITRGCDSYTLVSVTRMRQVFYTLLLVIQYFVVVMLSYAGSFYIIRELDLKDVLLNCSALAIVMDIDESMAVFVPCEVRHLLLSLNALPRPRPKSFKGITPRAALKIAIVLALMIFSVIALDSQAGTLEDMRFEICGGNLDFIAGVDKAGVVIAARPPLTPEDKSTYYDDAVYQLVRDDSSFFLDGDITAKDLTTVATSIEGGIWSLLGWLDAPPEKILNYWNYECKDMIPVEGSPYEYANHFLRLLREAVANPSVQDCSDIVQHCGSDSIKGVRTRQICPVTCGCTNPGSSLVLGEIEPGGNGCPPVCLTTSIYNEHMGRECKDLGLDSSYWSNYTYGLEMYMNSYDDWEGEILSLLKSNGCGAVSKEVYLWGYYWPDPCTQWADLRLKPLAYACPASCNCEAKHQPGCPEMC